MVTNKAQLVIIRNVKVINGEAVLQLPNNTRELICLTSALNVLKSNPEAITELNEKLQELHVKTTRDC